MRTNLTPATARNCFVASVIIALCGATAAVAGTHWIYHGPFTLDTRGESVGTISGTVYGNGTPLVHAHIETSVNGIPYTAVTASDGTFILYNVPCGTKHLLVISDAAWYQARITIPELTSAGYSVGTVALIYQGGPYVLEPLSPDINPPVSSVEEGGVAYRYYYVRPSRGGIASRIPFGVRRTDTSTMINQQALSNYWIKTDQTGTTSADGMLVVGVPSTELVRDTARVFQVMQGTSVLATFSAKARAPEYDRVWRIKSQGGLSAKFIALKSGGDASTESQLRHHVKDGTVTEEIITRGRAASLSGGFDIGAGVKATIGPVNAGVGYGKSVMATTGKEAEKTLVFNPSSTDEIENAMKLYLSLGDRLSVGISQMGGNPLIMGPVTAYSAFYILMNLVYENAFFESHLDSIRAGAFSSIEGEIEGRFGFYAKPDWVVGLYGSGHHEFGYVAGTEWKYDQPIEALYWGFEADSGWSINGGVSIFDDENEEKGRATTSLIENSYVRKYLGTVRRKDSVELIDGVEVTEESYNKQGMNVIVSYWISMLGNWAKDVTVETACKETTRLPIATWSQLSALFSFCDVWSDIANRSSSAWSDSDALALKGSLINYATAASLIPTYESTVAVGKNDINVLGFDVDLALVGLGLNDAGYTFERGVEKVIERGVWWKSQRLGLERYPALSATLIPTQTLADFESAWMAKASAVVGNAVNRLQHEVAASGITILQTINGTILEFLAGTMAAGSFIVCDSIKPLGGATQGSALKYGVKNSTAASYYPPPGASNYIYGIGSVTRFYSSNSFLGQATLSIAYHDAEITGLDEATLGIYGRPDGTNAWQSLGGVVDMDSNTVTCVISNLGTYTIAPAMPAGALAITLSTNQIPADGVTEITASTSGILLNTGTPATQQWLFTASAFGFGILDNDLDTNMPGVQVVSSNAAIKVRLRAPLGGTAGSFILQSYAGTAYGATGIPLYDDQVPAAPTSISLRAGQSRLRVAWDSSNAPPDLHGYCVYYRRGQNGPPFDGVASFEGASSPVFTANTNCLLRGLILASNYFVAVSAVDSSRNESALTPAGFITTVEQPPTPPTAVTARFGDDNTNVVNWMLSEDDGYNDRDVIGYDMYRAVMPVGGFTKIARTEAGINLFCDNAPFVSSTQYVLYAVAAVDLMNNISPQIVAVNSLGNGQGADNDWDGMPDWWENAYGLNPSNRLDGAEDSDGDGLVNTNEYARGTRPDRADTDGDAQNDGFEVRNGTDPLNNASFGASIAGTVSGGDTHFGDIWIAAVLEPDLWITNRAAVISAAGVFCVSNVPTLTNYWVKSFKDSNGDYTYSPGECWGMTSNSLYLTNNVDNIDITIVPEPAWGITLCALFLSLMRRRKSVATCCVIALFLTIVSAKSFAVNPLLSNIQVTPIQQTKTVRVSYRVYDPDSPVVTISMTVTVSNNNGVTYDVPATTFLQPSAVGLGVPTGFDTKQIIWNAGADWNGQFSDKVRIKITADDTPVPDGMALIPAGAFTMGDTFSEGYSDELPTHSVYISAFYMDKTEVTKAKWDEVYTWAVAHGYSFSAGAGKAANHPVQTVSWYDCVKWCNARSEKEGKTPCYYLSSTFTPANLYTNGSLNISAAWVNWSANGYRLPTEAEWEKAARGGLNGRRFPWNDLNITHTNANYNSYDGYSYDTSVTRGYHPTFNDGTYLYTSPVGYFAANGYGLYDMAGNVWEWCWDWYDGSWYSNGSATQTDTSGPTSSPYSYRVIRGGGWAGRADGCRVAGRGFPDVTYNLIGFRAVRR